MVQLDKENTRHCTIDEFVISDNPEIVKVWKIFNIKNNGVLEYDKKKSVQENVG